MEKFGVDGLITPDKPVFSFKGAVVANIAYIPMALSAVMRENATRPDFAAEGNLALKAWFGADQGLKLPAGLDVPVVKAMPPYDEQIAALAKQIGAVLPRQSMKDASGASQMDAKTQITSLYGVSMLDAAQYPLETNINLALLHETGGANDRKLINIAIGAELDLHGSPALAAAQAARESGNAPNSVLATAASIESHRFVLTPGRYAGTADDSSDDDEGFSEKFMRLTTELEGLIAEARHLEATILARLGSIDG